MSAQPAILFSAFEPSGDALAARLARELRRREPDRPLFALGGPRLADAGATLLEDTTRKPAMLVRAAAQVLEHRARLQRLAEWLKGQPIAAVIPTDSPAANWSICGVVRKAQRQARVIHLVCPQIWAWATWRIGKLRRLTDHVLCVLPFEPAWLEQRGVAGTFVGHPLFDADRAASQAQRQADRSTGSLALLPGSRMAEIAANWGTMCEVLRSVHERVRGVRTHVAAASDAIAQRLRASPEAAGLPMTIDTGQVDAILAGADAGLIVSGTATLHAAAYHCPMVVLYNVNWWSWQLAGRFLIRTRTFSLPNLLAEGFGFPSQPPARRRVPEFIPHFGEVGPVADALVELLTDPAARQRQHELFTMIDRAYDAVPFATTAADVVERLLR